MASRAEEVPLGKRCVGSARVLAAKRHRGFGLSLAPTLGVPMAHGTRVGHPQRRGPPRRTPSGASGAARLPRQPRVAVARPSRRGRATHGHRRAAPAPLRPFQPPRRRRAQSPRRRRPRPDRPPQPRSSPTSSARSATRSTRTAFSSCRKSSSRCSTRSSRPTSRRAPTAPSPANSPSSRSSRRSSRTSAKPVRAQPAARGLAVGNDGLQEAEEARSQAARRGRAGTDRAGSPGADDAGRHRSGARRQEAAAAVGLRAQRRFRHHQAQRLSAQADRRRDLQSLRGRRARGAGGSGQLPSRLHHPQRAPVRHLRRSRSGTGARSPGPSPGATSAATIPIPSASLPAPSGRCRRANTPSRPTRSGA